MTHWKISFVRVTLKSSNLSPVHTLQHDRTSRLSALQEGVHPALQVRVSLVHIWRKNEIFVAIMIFSNYFDRSLDML